MDNLLFILSFVMLFFGGELLVRSSVSLALRMRISTLVVGMTVVSFATSSPELFVSIKSAWNGLTDPRFYDITFGNVIGSNIANITLVLGLTAIVFRINITKQTIKINFPVMFFTFILFGSVLYLFNEINQITGIIFVSLLIIFGWILIKRSREENKKLSEQEKEEYEKARKTPLLQSILYMIVGIFLLMYGSQFLVNGVEILATDFGISERVLSVSLVAIGTSLPELATSLVAAFRKESNLAIGNLIGSNIFNVLAVLGITSIITPIKMINESLFTDYLWMMISVLILGLFIYVFSKKQVSRTEGFLLLVFYILFMFFLF
ncbi:MAG: calcium/sodium antiporter [Flavobacteriales bacterium]|jgi:cation:H+ antiporter|nr:calcium/sodium antiporter [Flavobacteriales bacterium]